MRPLLCLLALGVSAAEGRPKQLTGIDDYCNRLKTEFVEARPILFSGPDPWTELDEPPPHFRDEALATVYLDGEKIRWVVMQLGTRQDAWSETVQYFYGTDGNLVKRERYLDEPASNTALEETLYYHDGELLRKYTKHRALAGRRENDSMFENHDAPEYLSTSDLPFPKVNGISRRLAKSFSFTSMPGRDPKEDRPDLPTQPTA